MTDDCPQKQSVAGDRFPKMTTTQFSRRRPHAGE